MEVDSPISRFCETFNYHIKNFIEKPLSENVTGFFYESESKQTSISFYILQEFTNSHMEFKPIHKRIWSENKADIYIIINKKGGRIYYAKSLPDDALKEDIKIDDFSYGELNPTEEFQKKIALKKFSVDSGLFIEAYQKRLREIQNKKKKTVDQALINTIEYLRDNVSDYINIENPNKRREFIQTLIDRSIFIKFLEERSLLKSIYEDFGVGINSYKDILNLNDIERLNIFFERINQKFNGDLFKEPKIDKKYFTEKSLTNILELFIRGAEVRREKAGGASAQLPLFDYDFNIIPVELLSNIYESFLAEKRKEEGVYYTPNPIIDIILKDTLEEYIKTEGLHPKILDPSCGSGNFLVRAFKKLIELSEKNGELSLQNRMVLLQDCIFGIDKDSIAARITVFSLYISLFEGLDDEKFTSEIFEFPKLLNKNVLVSDSIDVNFKKNIHFINSKNERIERFDIIVGNPPWGRIQENSPGHEFYLQNQDKIDDKEISQAFIIQVPEWANSMTRFGFIMKGTNFLNIRKYFFNFFFSNFILERYYDLTKAKEIIFEDSKFPTSIIIFRQRNNKEINSNFLYYRPIESKLSRDLKILFLEKEKIELDTNIMHDQHLFIKLLSGNKWDIELIDKLQKYPKISISLDPVIRQGAIIEDKREFQNHIRKIKSTKDLDDRRKKIVQKLMAMGLYERFISGSPKEFDNIYKDFIDRIITDNRINDNYLPLIRPENIENYKIKKPTKFIDYGTWLGMPRDESIFKGRRLYIRETIIKPYRLCAALCEDDTVTDHNYILKNKNENVIYFFLALFNSLFASFYLSFTSPRYATMHNPEISRQNLEGLPYTKFKDPEVFEDIVNIAKYIHSFVNNKVNEDSIKENNLIKALSHKYFIEIVYNENLEQLLHIQDELIFEFYGLNGKERQRIRDFFIPENETVIYDDMEKYAETFRNILSPYIIKEFNLYYNYYIPHNGIFDFAAIEFIIGGKPQLERKTKINYKTILEFIGQELIKDKQVSFIPGGQFEIYHDDCLFIIKPAMKKVWSKTKAIEDAMSELEKIRSYYAR